MFTEWFSSFICLADVLACMLSHFCCFQLCVTLCIIACQVPLSMGFSRKQYWSALPCSPPGNLPDPRIGPAYLAWQAFSLLLSHHGSPLSNPLVSPSLSADPEHARPVSLCAISPALCLLSHRNSSVMRKPVSVHTRGFPHPDTKSTALRNDRYVCPAFQARAGFHTQPNSGEG